MDGVDAQTAATCGQANQVQDGATSRRNMDHDAHYGEAMQCTDSALFRSALDQMIDEERAKARKH